MAKRRRNCNVASSSNTSSTSHPSSAASPIPNLTSPPSNTADPSPPLTPSVEANMNVVTDNEDVPRNTRGPSMLRKFFKLAALNKVVIAHNKYGQAIGDGSEQFESVCGYIARNGHYCPLTYPRWNKMPETFKVVHMNFLKRYFIFDEKAMKSYIRKDIGKKWRNWKNAVRSQFEANKSIEYNLKKEIDRRVDPNQWAQLVPIWNTKESKDISEQAKNNNSKLKAPHTCGRTSYARKRDKMEKARGGAEVGDIEFFQRTHTRVDGSLDDDALGIMDQCLNIIEQRALDLEEVNNNPDLQANILRDVRGEERPGQVRGMGLGVTPSMVFGNKRMRAEIEKLKDTYDSNLQSIQKNHEEEMAQMKANEKKHEAEMMELRAMLQSILAGQQSEM